MNGDNITMLHTEVVSDNSVNPNAAIVKVVIGQNDQNGVFRFLPLTRTVSPRNSWRVSMVLLERAMIELSSLTASVTLDGVSYGVLFTRHTRQITHIKELGFFFFLRMAVAVSSS